MFKKLLLFLFIFFWIFSKSYASLDSYIYWNITNWNLSIFCWNVSLCNTVWWLPFSPNEDLSLSNNSVWIIHWLNSWERAIRKWLNISGYLMSDIYNRQFVTWRSWSSVCQWWSIASVSVNNIILNYCNPIDEFSSVSSSYWQSIFYCNWANETLNFTNNVPICENNSWNWYDWIFSSLNEIKSAILDIVNTLTNFYDNLLNFFDTYIDFSYNGFNFDLNLFKNFFNFWINKNFLNWVIPNTKNSNSQCTMYDWISYTSQWNIDFANYWINETNSSYVEEQSKINSKNTLWNYYIYYNWMNNPWTRDTYGSYSCQGATPDNNYNKLSPYISMYCWIQYIGYPNEYGHTYKYNCCSKLYYPTSSWLSSYNINNTNFFSINTHIFDNINYIPFSFVVFNFDIVAMVNGWIQYAITIAFNIIVIPFDLVNYFFNYFSNFFINFQPNSNYCWLGSYYPMAGWITPWNLSWYSGPWYTGNTLSIILFILLCWVLFKLRRQFNF